MSWFWIIIIFIILLIIIIVIIIGYIYASIFFPGLLLSKSNIKYVHDVKELDHFIKECKVLDLNEVDDIIYKIDDLRRDKIFIKRNSVMDTIGIPSYLDLPFDNYHKIKYYNDILSNNFSFLYPKLISNLEKMLGKKCIYPTNEEASIISTSSSISSSNNDEEYKNENNKDNHLYSLPGFHIFGGKTWLGAGWSVASLHIDKQFNRVEFPSNMKFDYEKTISFTLAISVPDNSGLYIYDEKENTKELRTKYKNTYHYLKNKTRYKVNYEIGHMYVHDGVHYHMISEFNSIDDRITLQGHGIYCETTDSYWLYW